MGQDQTQRLSAIYGKDAPKPLTSIGITKWIDAQKLPRHIQEQRTLLILDTTAAFSSSDNPTQAVSELRYLLTDWGIQEKAAKTLDSTMIIMLLPYAKTYCLSKI